MQESRTLRLTRRELETWLGWNCEPTPQAKAWAWKSSTRRARQFSTLLERGHWKSTRQGNSLVAYSTARPVLNGGDEETGLCRLRLVATQHHHTGKVLAYVFGRRQDTVFLAFKALLAPFGITRYFTDGWEAYERHVAAEQPTMRKAHIQEIESKHINVRTRIKRLVHQTLCFSKTEHMHNLVIGLFINWYGFGASV